MKIAVRYYSKTGRTEKIANALAKGADTKAVSITEQKKLDSACDILFLGGAPYANVMAPELREYVENISPKKVGEVVLFTTSNWSRRTLRGMRKILNQNGIKVSDKTFYAHALQIEKKMKEAEDFAGKIIK